MYTAPVAPVVNASLFTYNGDNRTFVCEHSDLYDHFRDIPHTINLRGRKDTVRFDFDSVERDREGDVIAWKYVGVHDGQLYRVTMYND